MMLSFLLSWIVIGAWLIPQGTFGQIPTACADEESLENLRCCPATADGVCGEDAGRGECAELNIKGYSRNTTNARDNWPHYFTHVCQCNGNYLGYDCSRCKFGHYGPDCSQSDVLPRRPLASYTNQEWEELIEIIQMLHSHDSGYTVILEESFPGNSNLLMTNITLYKLYVWIHHYASRDTAEPDINLRIDYAHFGPSFNTWHRYFNLWFEWEMQYMLQSMGHDNYHSFRLPYWDWRIEIQNSTGIRVEDLLTEKRFGATENINGFPRVVGDIVGPNGWITLCSQINFEMCDPDIDTGPLQRCPFTGTNPCHSSNPDWPTIKQVNDAIAIDHYDSPPYNLLSKTGYRAFIDFHVHDDFEECRDDRMCQCIPLGGTSCDLSTVPSNVTVAAYNGQLHTDAHIILGLGDFSANTPVDRAGQIYDPVASANDPVFIIHHTMVDCMFDEWLKLHPNEEYPDVPLTPSTRGHQLHSYMIPFFPLYTNADMFKLANNFGYFCNIPNITADSVSVDSGSSGRAQLTMLIWFGAVSIFIAIINMN